MEFRILPGYIEFTKPSGKRTLRHALSDPIERKIEDKTFNVTIKEMKETWEKGEWRFLEKLPPWYCRQKLLGFACILWKNNAYKWVDEND